MLKLGVISMLFIGLTITCLESIAEPIYDYPKHSIDTYDIHKIVQKCKQEHQKIHECNKRVELYIDSNTTKGRP